MGADKRLEMYRKLRKEMESENREEKEAAFKKRSEELAEKDKSVAALGEGDDFLKGMKGFSTKD